MSKIKRYSFSPLIENTEKSILKQSKSLIPQKEIEMGTLMNLLTSVHPPIESITIGHGRDNVSKEIAYAIAELWETKGGSEGKGGYVLNIVDWLKRLLHGYVQQYVSQMGNLMHGLLQGLC